MLPRSLIFLSLVLILSVQGISTWELVKFMLKKNKMPRKEGYVQVFEQGLRSIADFPTDAGQIVCRTSRPLKFLQAEVFYKKNRLVVNNANQSTVPMEIQYLVDQAAVGRVNYVDLYTPRLIPTGSYELASTTARMMIRMEGQLSEALYNLAFRDKRNAKDFLSKHGYSNETIERMIDISDGFPAFKQDWERTIRVVVDNIQDLDQSRIRDVRKAVTDALLIGPSEMVQTFMTDRSKRPLVDTTRLIQEGKREIAIYVFSQLWASNHKENETMLKLTCFPGKICEAHSTVLQAAEIECEAFGFLKRRMACSKVNEIRIENPTVELINFL